MNTENREPPYYYQFIDKDDKVLGDLRFENGNLKNAVDLDDRDLQYFPQPIHYRGFAEMIEDGMYLYAKYMYHIKRVRILNFDNEIVCTIDHFDRVPAINWNAVQVVFERNVPPSKRYRPPKTESEK